MKVYINSKDRASRQLVEVELLKENGNILIVKLPNGDIIKRKKNRDLPK